MPPMYAGMRSIMVRKLLLILILLPLLCISSGYAKEISASGLDACQAWTGQWSGDWFGKNLVIHLNQSGNEVHGDYSYTRADPSVQGMVQGTLSEDGRQLSGSWEETGNLTLILSDDMLSLSGIWGYDPDTYEWFEGVYTDRWDGIWNSESHSLSLIQNGTGISGTFVSLIPGHNDSGFIQGTLREDEKIVHGTFSTSGTIVYTLSDDGKGFVANYSYGKAAMEKDDFWMATCDH